MTKIVFIALALSVAVLVLSQETPSPTPTAPSGEDRRMDDEGMAPQKPPMAPQKPPKCPECDKYTFCCNQECVKGSLETHICCETNDSPYSCVKGEENCCGTGTPEGEGHEEMLEESNFDVELGKQRV
eukprot:CAMPEP_0184674106 /NCGR_PEP_ID=MMETSP0308-20130426/87057_1 /TAXON_ID=38269 /ORGANISM="Gloeochaete witrockiana, Strain SAG 46.84" /LENGTH=127 /DNA_ID=CAMNT_0027121677 /DNA_START=144 /DNA_END=528 /DNA_ORIENTATION=-